MLNFLKTHAVAIASGLLSAAIAIGASVYISQRTIHPEAETVESDLPYADTPPAEYLYLDTARVLTYLGQIEGGLSADEKRTLGVSQKTSAQLSAGTVAQLSAASERQIGSEATVTPTVADRFYRFLRLLRVDRSKAPPPTLDHGGRWLNDIDASVSAKYTPAFVRRKVLDPLKEGQFVRISEARLCAPSYADLLPKLTYVPTCTARSKRLGRPVPQPHTQQERVALRDYARRLPKTGSLPFMAKTLRQDRANQPRDVITFVMPTPYAALTRNAALLGDPVTIVGKVVYKDTRLRRTTAASDRRPLRYVDRSTIRTFAPLLKRGDPALLRRAHLGTKAKIAARLRRSVTVLTPVVVLLPVAIYD